jgi:hypothetical protein
MGSLGTPSEGLAVLVGANKGIGLGVSQSPDLIDQSLDINHHLAGSNSAALALWHHTVDHCSSATVLHLLHFIILRGNS